MSELVIISVYVAMFILFHSVVWLFLRRDSDAIV